MSSIRTMTGSLLGAASCTLLLLTLSLQHASASAADTLKSSIDMTVGTNKAGASSQKKIDALDADTQQMLADYRATLAQIESLQVYNNQLQKLTLSQQQELDSYEQQLATIEATRSGVVPLMLRMIETLDAFRGLDLPFLVQERRSRVVLLHQMMDRADVSMAEKYRRIMAAWQAENEYGRTIEAYRAGLQKDNDYRVVDFLRVGRVALLYQTLDGRESGYWDHNSKQWQILPDNYRAAVKKALDVARKRVAPDLLILPVAAAKESAK